MERLSKYLSYVLRHNPASLGLTMDAEGFVSVDQLLVSLRRQRKWSWVGRKDLVELLGSGEKKRFEIVGPKIRALYGHTVASRIVHETVVPPEVLYHGTPRKNFESILRNGIMPMRRQYVHLSTTAQEAENVGFRRDEKPAILRVLALEAYKNGVRFYKAGSIYLSDPIPPNFIERKID